MKRMPSALHGKEGAITAAAAALAVGSEDKKERERAEPRSVLDHHRSPSPSTSGDVAAVSDPSKWPPSAKEEWELQPLDSTATNHSPSMDDDWDSMLSDHSSPFLRWITSDTQNPQTHYVQQQQQQQQHMLSLPIPDLDPSLLLEGVSDSIPLDPLLIPSASSFPFPQPPTMFYQEPNLLLPFPQQQHHQQQQIFLPTSQFQAQRLPAKAKASAAATDESSAAVEQLVKAAEQLEAGNSVNAHGILARLNQLSPHHGKPLLRSAFYFKEALGAVVLSRDVPQPPGTPWDVVLKLSAYKSFSEASPLPQFTHFTCVQALLEELTSCERIHIIDFDVGVGGQWSSFLQELSQRCPSASPSLKITAFVSPASHQQLELMLVRDNLTQFASELGIPFEFNAHSVDSFELAVLSLSSGGDDAIAVNLPAGSCCGASGSQLLRLVKQLSPKIVISTDYGGDRCELPFSQHLLHSLRSYSVLIDSINAANANLDVSTKIGKFLLQPRIEKSVYRRYRSGDKMLPWRALFASAGFVPLQFSNFTETQAECLLKRTPTRGFHVEKRQSSLVLFWQREELASVSAWRC